ncbi:MAG: hypothetical protein NDI84_12940 [Steroidobacteraceae bacterium]|nr:hypothetical protein [Steroidobacteraceae bacterium]
MTSAELDNLVRIGKLKREPTSARELLGLLASARERLADADNPTLAFASRFDLAYNSSHALALYALRHAGYRCDARYLAFQTLPHTLGMPVDVWRVLAKAHERRNLAEYEGHLEHDERLLADVLTAARRVLAVVETLAESGATG